MLPIPPSVLTPSLPSEVPVVKHVTEQKGDAVPDTDKAPVMSTLAAARWIGFSEEVVQAFNTPIPSKELKPAIDLLAQLPQIRMLHAAQRVHESITKATLMDMEVWLKDYHQKHDVWGFTAEGWLKEHFSGSLYALGRLQFQICRYELPEVPEVLAHGDPVLHVHIPATGKLDDKACTESFRQALEFFSHHFPDHKFKAFVCDSWIMNPNLLPCLPADSNLKSFQRRFKHIELPEASDDQMWERVFGGRPKDLADAPQRTSLQRTILEKVKTGVKFQMAAGYILRV